MTRIFLLFAVTAVALATSVFAASDHLATIERECGVQLGMSPAQCACLKGKASALNEGQQAFIAAVVSKDKATQQDLTQGMTVQELTEAGMFMTNAPAQCARGQ